jgi:hypothetical protein
LGKQQRRTHHAGAEHEKCPPGQAEQTRHDERVTQNIFCSARMPAIIPAARSDKAL